MGLPPSRMLHRCSPGLSSHQNTVRQSICRRKEMNVKIRVVKFVAGALAAMLLMSTMAACQGTETGSDEEVTSSEAIVSSAAEDTESEAEEDSIDTYAIYSGALNDEGGFTGVTAAEFVTLPDYESYEVPADVTEITDDAVQEELDTLVSNFTTTEQVTDRAVEDGDTVSIDYVGSVDGVEFEGGNTNGSGAIVTIGVTSYIDDFLEQLIGHKPGDTFDVEVTFPDPYENNTDLSGKDAVFVTTINYIEEEATPEFNDEFVQTRLSSTEGWTTVDEAKAGVREKLRKSAVQSHMFTYVVENAEISEMPEAVYQYQVDTMVGYYTQAASSYGYTLDEMLEQMEVENGVEGLEEKYRETLENNAKTTLVLQALAEKMGVLPTDDDVADYMKNNVGEEDYSDIETNYGKPYLMLLTKENLVKSALAELA